MATSAMSMCKVPAFGYQTWYFITSKFFTLGIILIVEAMSLSLSIENSNWKQWPASTMAKRLREKLCLQNAQKTRKSCFIL